MAVDVCGPELGNGEGTRLSVAVGAMVNVGRRDVECFEGGRRVGSMGDAR